nr:tetratricopeptide repeat protein [Bdellovibrionales bacterium]
IVKTEIPTLSSSEVDLWRSLNGWPEFSGQDFVPEIINNLRLYDLSVSQNKGCYPGQETVSKIATRRGAAYSPVLLETDTMQSTGAIFIFDKKIGEIESCHEWDGVFYSSAKLLRDFRVAGMKITFLKDGKETSSNVRYYPLLPGSEVEKSLELYYAALEAFKKDDFITAETNLKQAIELNPKFADAYESLGVILGRLERFPEAIVLMDHLTAVDPSSVLAHTNKSLFLMKMGKIEEAEEQKSLATIKSFQKFGDEAKLKEQIQTEKKAQEAEWLKRENMFKQVLEIDEEDTLANYGLGSIAVERQDWQVAIKHLEKVIQADINYSVAYLALGKAYKGAGKKDLAEKTWKEGINIAAKKGDLMPANQMQFELQQL